MKTEKRVIRNSLLMFGQNVVVYGLTLFVAGVMARRLGQEHFGIFNYSFVFADIFFVFATLGLRSVTVREVAQSKGSIQNYIEMAFTLRFLLGLIAWLILVGVAWIMHRDSLVFICLAIASVSVVLNSVSTFMRDVFQGMERMEVEASTQIAIRFFTLIGVITAFHCGGGLLSVVAIYTAGSIVGVAIPFAALRRAGIPLRFRLSLPDTKKELRKGLPFAVNSWIGLFRSKVNPILLGQMGTQAMVGVFTAGKTLLYPMYVIPDSISTALYPTIAREWRNPSAKVELLLQRLYFYITLLGLPIGIGGFICAEQVIGLIFGPGYPEAARVFKILVLIMPLEFLTLPATYALGAIHQQRKVVITTVSAAIVNVLLNILLIPAYGAIGSAFAGVAVSVLYFAMSQYFLSRHFHTFGDSPRYFRLILATVLMAAVVYPLRNSNPAISILSGMAVYACLVLGLRVLTLRQARDFIQQAMGRSTADL